MVGGVPVLAPLGIAARRFRHSVAGCARGPVEYLDPRDLRRDSAL
jgi:hypothetical protein